MREDTDNIAAKLQRGVESVRLVFWVSFRSQQARKIIQKDDPEEGGAWSIVVVACDFGKTESFVTSFNKKLVCLNTIEESRKMEQVLIATTNPLSGAA